MKKNAFLAKVGLVTFLGLAAASALTSCGPEESTSVATSVATSTIVPGVIEEADYVDPWAGVQNGGAYNYVGSSYEDRTEILGKLEKYAYQNYLTGIPLYENGGKVLYNTRIVKGTPNYITGYGFGILAEGSITSPMTAENEPTAAYRSYYHNWESSDPSTINALDSDGSQVSDLYANASASYWGTKMNESKDGYEYYPSLAKDAKPIPLDADGNVIDVDDPNWNGLASKWKIRVKTGVDGVKYATSSTKRAKYNGRDVQLADYVNAFKFLLTQGNAQYRGGELAGQAGSSGIVGAAGFYSATGAGYDASAWGDYKNTGSGVAVVADATDNSITIDLLAPTTQFYAMYNLNSNLYEPIPSDFIDEVGAENYGNYSSDKATSPIDNILCLGPYQLENWQDDKEIAFKKNAAWFEFKTGGELEGMYSIEGIHTSILSAYATDTAAAFKEFIAGKLDAAGLPDDYLDAFGNDPRATTVPGDSVFKLNVNSTTEEDWVKMFGTDGTIAQTQESDYFDVKPWMSNSAFLDGLMLSINRQEFAENRGVIPSIDYFSSNYMANPETGLSYNDTAAHKTAIDSVFGNAADTYGFSVEGAKVMFKTAVDQMVASGDIKLGTIENPTKLTLNFEWMYANQIDKVGADIQAYLEATFNDLSVSGGKVVLDIEQHAGAEWYNVYYDQLMVGQFDLGFGSISGNTLNPLNFLEVLKSNNDSGFTLNWGPDTSLVLPTTDPKSLQYDGQVWSFDALWRAADQGAVVADGAELPVATLQFTKKEITAEGDLLVTLAYGDATGAAGFADVTNLEVSIDDFYIWDGASYQDYLDVDGESSMFSGVVDAEAGTVVFTITAENITAFKTTVNEDQTTTVADVMTIFGGIDFTYTIDGIPASSYVEAAFTI